MNDDCSRKKRLRGGGQKAAHYGVESSLADWVILQREKHLWVTRQLIASQGKQMIQDPDFKASRGWTDHFMSDWGFAIHMKTTVGQHLPRMSAIKCLTLYGILQNKAG